MSETIARIANNIAFYRNQKGLTQKELAKAIGTTGNTVSNWEKEVSRVDIESLIAICSVLHVSLNDIYGVKKEPAPETDSLEWLRQGLIDSKLIKHRTELTDEQFKLLFGTIEAITKGFKQDIIK